MQVFGLDKIKQQIAKEGGQPLYQAGDRAAVQFLDDHRAIMHALEHADPTSLGHELGHVFRRDLSRNDPGLHDIAEKALGVTGGNWTRDHEEHFARGFENYLASGQAPTAGLAKVFAKFKEWMTNIYRSIVGTPLEHKLNPQLKSVFDNMLNGKGGGIAPPARVLPNGMPVDPMDPNSLRRFLEMKKGGPTASPEVQAYAKKAAERSAQRIAEARDRGMPLDELTDTAINYHPRKIVDKMQAVPGKAGKVALSASDEHALGRKEYYGGIDEGTSLLNEVGRHPELNRLIEENAPTEDVAKFIKSEFGHRIPDTYVSKEMENAIDPLTKKPKLDPITGKYVMQPVVKPRYDELAKSYANITKEVREANVFGNHPVVDERAARLSHSNAMLNTDTVFDTLAQPGVLQAASNAAKSEGTMSIGELLPKLGLNPGDHNEGALQRILKVMGTPARSTQDTDALSKMRIDKSLGEELSHMIKRVSGPDPVSPILDFTDSIMNITKGGQTSPWIGFHARNFSSGQIASAFAGIWGSKDVKAMDQLLKGKVVTGAKDNPAVQSLYKDKGLKVPLDDTLGTNLLGEILHGVGAVPKAEHIGGDVVGKAVSMAPGSIDELTSGVPGVGREMFNWKKAGRLFAGLEPNTTLNPLKATYRGVNGATESTFGPFAAGNYLGNHIEGLNRGSGVINQTRKGVDPHAAAVNVGNIQANYGSKHFTKFENDVMKRLFPYYSFTKGMAKYVPQHLAQNPGGPMAQSIRVANRARQPDEVTPDYIASTASLPLAGIPGLSPSDPEVKRYITSLGMMHEDPLQFVGGGARGTLLEMLSRTNPLIKAPVEWGLGRSAFQTGPGGGRDLSEMDPSLGRLLANVSGRPDAVKFPGSEGIEHILSNSPAGRAITTARQLTDPRKGLGVKGLGTLTGLRIADVSAKSRDAIERQMVAEALRERGGKQFVRNYLPESVKATMTPQQVQEAQLLHDRLNQLAKDAKRRKELAAAGNR